MDIRLGLMTVGLMSAMALGLVADITIRSMEDI